MLVYPNYSSRFPETPFRDVCALPIAADAILLNSGGGGS